MSKHISHEDMVANIHAYYVSATTYQLTEGRQWYKVAGRVVGAIADYTGLPRSRVAHALAALSPRNPWRWNVFDAYSFASAIAEGRTMPTATTFKRNWQAAWRALNGEDAWTTSAPKVRNFVAAILGDGAAVVVDTWAVRVATGGALDTVRNDADYLRIAEAYRKVASMTGELPCELQAITWLVAQSEGLASHRRGRHDLAYKAGTPDFIRELV